MRLISILTVLCSFGLPLAAQDQIVQDQIVINDSRQDWRQHTFVPVLQPGAWGEYAEGDLYLRYQVIDKPSDIEIMPMICLWQGNFGDPDFLETCTQMGALVKFRSEGTYFQKFNGPATDTNWQNPHGTGYEKSEPTDRIMHQWWVREDGRNKVLRASFGESYDYGDGVDAHIPIDFKCTMILVKPGATFVPPADWIGCSWGCATSFQREDLLIVGDQPRWMMDPSRRVVFEPATFEGRASLKLEGSGSWSLSAIPEEPVNMFGFTALTMMFHPADFSVAEGRDPRLWVGDVDLLERIDLHRQEWQRVTIPIAKLKVEQITPLQPLRFFGSLLGTFYLGDVRLVGQKAESATAISEEMLDSQPGKFTLSQNYPNPFNPETTIRFNLPLSRNVDLSLYNLAGQRVATLVGGPREAGSYSLRWDGTNDAGHDLASGMYIYRLTTGNQVQTRKLMLLR